METQRLGIKGIHILPFFLIEKYFGEVLGDSPLLLESYLCLEEGDNGWIPEGCGGGFILDFLCKNFCCHN